MKILCRGDNETKENRTLTHKHTQDPPSEISFDSHSCQRKINLKIKKRNAEKTRKQRQQQKKAKWLKVAAD